MAACASSGKALSLAAASLGSDENRVGIGPAGSSNLASQKKFLLLLIQVFYKAGWLIKWQENGHALILPAQPMPSQAAQLTGKLASARAAQSPDSRAGLDLTKPSEQGRPCRTSSRDPDVVEERIHLHTMPAPVSSGCESSYC